MSEDNRIDQERGESADLPTNDPSMNAGGNDWVPETLTRPSVSGSQSYGEARHEPSREPQYTGEAEGDHYTVMEGDTLETIAARFYGSAAEYDRIFQANQDRLSNPDLIYPGQELVIPRGD